MNVKGKKRKSLLTHIMPKIVYIKVSELDFYIL